MSPSTRGPRGRRSAAQPGLSQPSPQQTSPTLVAGQRRRSSGSSHSRSDLASNRGVQKSKRTSRLPFDGNRLGRPRNIKPGDLAHLESGTCLPPDPAHAVAAAIVPAPAAPGITACGPPAPNQPFQPGLIDTDGVATPATSGQRWAMTDTASRGSGGGALPAMPSASAAMGGQGSSGPGGDDSLLNAVFSHYPLMRHWETAANEAQVFQQQPWGPDNVEVDPMCYFGILAGEEGHEGSGKRHVETGTAIVDTRPGFRQTMVSKEFLEERKNLQAVPDLPRYGGMGFIRLMVNMEAAYPFRPILALVVPTLDPGVNMVICPEDAASLGWQTRRTEIQEFPGDLPYQAVTGNEPVDVAGISEARAFVSPSSAGPNIASDDPLVQPYSGWNHLASKDVTINTDPFLGYSGANQTDDALV